MKYRKGYERKLEEGQLRNALWRKLSPAEQVISLDRRLGVGVGAVRQRAKLAKAIVDAQKPKRIA